MALKLAFELTGILVNLVVFLSTMINIDKMRQGVIWLLVCLTIFGIFISALGFFEAL